MKVYQKCLKRYPLLVQSVQTGILVGSGDLIAQTVVEQTHITNLNVIRTAQFAGMGFFLMVCIE